MSDFARLLETEIPRLRRYARALTRDVTRAVAPADGYGRRGPARPDRQLRIRRRGPTPSPHPLSPARRAAPRRLIGAGRALANDRIRQSQSAPCVLRDAPFGHSSG